MANRRMLGKSVSTSRKLMKVTDFAALLWTWTISHCDDLGHMDGSPEMIKGIVVPLRKKTTDEIINASKELETAELWKFYEIEGERYLEVIKWEEFQTFKNDRELQIDFPIAPWNPEDSKRNPDGKIVRVREEKRSKENIREEKEEKLSTSLKYLSDIPNEDIKEFFDRFDATPRQIKSKAEDLLNYCKSKGKIYKDYKAFLLNALKKDFKPRIKSIGRVEETDDRTPEERERAREALRQITSSLTKDKKI